MTTQERIAQLEVENKSLRVGIELNKPIKKVSGSVSQRNLQNPTNGISYQHQNNCAYLTIISEYKP